MVTRLLIFSKPSFQIMIKKFEIVLVLNNPKEDKLTENFKNLVDETINISKLNNIDM